jgi:hypothetical protein
MIGLVVLILGSLGMKNDESLNMIYILLILGGILSIVTGLYVFVFSIKDKRKRLIALILLTLLLICIPIANKYALPGDAVFSFTL